MSKQYKFKWLYKTTQEAIEVANLVNQNKFVEVIQDYPNIGRIGSKGQLSLPHAFIFVLTEVDYVFGPSNYLLNIVRRTNTIKELEVISDKRRRELTCYQKLIQLNFGEKTYLFAPNSPWSFKLSTPDEFLLVKNKPKNESVPKDYFGKDLVDNETYIASNIQGKHGSQTIGKITETIWDQQANRFTFLVECAITGKIVRCKSVMRLSSLDDDLFEAKLRN